ncbi:hypothetical protein EHS25_000510 [Saitozyma podzolica]|uniref:SDE2-like domain-containing protein n=1 Tax=Saitozyma podzolica TaxID=1890683 RepID=A0A427YWB6_9TREE|nr:hypothetical protein EHS25_000510 [Saitozyma podzolica]
MSASKATNVDSCRDLSGRRLGTIKEAQRQAELLESAPALRAAAKAAEKAKLEALERQLGINAAESASTEAGPSSGSGSKRIAEVDLEELAKKKHKFEDSKFLEESREINDNVRSAVSAAMLLKKKKKAKADAANASSSKSVVAVDAAKKAEKDKVAMPPPAVSAAASAVPAA